MPEQVDAARERIARVFQFLRAFNQIRNPSPRLISEESPLWLDEVPESKFVVVARAGAELPDAVLTVRRPKLTECPPLPRELADWVAPGWHDPDAVATRISRRQLQVEGHEVETEFTDDSCRTDAWERWTRDRLRWASAESPLRAIDRLFQRLYALRARMERESERIELVLGDGILHWAQQAGAVHYPLLSQRLQLEFDPDKPEFRIVETDHAVEFNSALLRSIEKVDGRAIARCLDDLDTVSAHPLDGAETASFFGRVAVELSPRGWTTTDLIVGAPADPIVQRRLVIFVRSRAQGYAKVLESILADIETRSDFPTSLTRVVGIDARNEGQPERATSDADDVLLSKPANIEQVQIAQRLEKHGAVLVQGPPGTGKSHTIANLIGHLLAQGRSILVTSHTTKALRVLRDHVVPELRPLCVAVLDSDAESREQMDGAVDAIAQRLSHTDAETVLREATTLRARRAQLRAELDRAKAELLDGRLAEARPVVVAGTSYRPQDAARYVTERAPQDGWIPGSTVPGAPVPLSRAEFDELYASNSVIAPVDESSLAESVPDVRSFPSPEEFEQATHTLGAPPPQDRPEFWATAVASTDRDGVRAAWERVSSAAREMVGAAKWKRAAAVAGMHGTTARAMWESLITEVERTLHLQADSAELLFQASPSLSNEFSPEDQERLATEIRDSLADGKTLGRWALLTHGTWRRFVTGCEVRGREPRTREDFDALRAAAALTNARGELGRRWAHLIEIHDGPSWGSLGDRPEAAATLMVRELKGALEWWSGTMRAAMDGISTCGFRWREFLDAQPLVVGQDAEFTRLLAAISAPLGPIVEARLQAVYRAELLAWYEEIGERARSEGATGTLHRVIAAAVQRREPLTYRTAYERAGALQHLRRVLARRSELLEKLAAAAPAWSAAIRTRHDIHGQSRLPANANPEAAWLWSQLHGDLERRAELSLTVLQDRATTLEKQLREATVALIDKLAWKAQLGERTQLPQRQALMGWRDTIRRIGAGHGVRVPALKKQAARLMTECRSAVPVWIMPLSRVAEHFDGSTRFDVVIIDEASQSDVMGLAAWYIAKSVVVVGDHKQVSPSAVGQQAAQAAKLIDAHLDGIPNAPLYDGRTSIYDLASHSFDGIICLTEHFRCVPDIIQFSNRFYDWRIRPLRDPSGVTRRPYVVPYRVHAARKSGKVNEQEAACVASLLLACTEQEEYAQSTFGVVSLVGDEQAEFIERLLRQHMSESQYERCRLLCGNAAQFQGDERDVVFLSLVDTSEDGGPLPLRTQPQFEQRFNVAASRARDQLWVVHSLDHQVELKPGDLRRELIEHALDPGARERQLQALTPQVESPFESEVLRRLVLAGYSVTPQWKVGAYRIDLVVEGRGQRLAVECDGDRYHDHAALEKDMQRQAILERLGWKFVRIRGSLFFRDPERAMRPVFEKLRMLQIEPSDAPGQPERSGEILERISRRAAEIRASWGAAAPEPVEVPDNTWPAARDRPVRDVVQDEPPPSNVLVLPLAERVDARATLANPPMLDVRISQRVAPQTGPLPAAVDSQPVGLPANPLHVAAGGQAEIVAQIRARLRPDDTRCPICSRELELRVRFFGPYLPCGANGCAGKRNLPPELVEEAVTAAQLRCACSGTLRVRRSKGRTFLGCSNYPGCRRIVAWKDL